MSPEGIAALVAAGPWVVVGVIVVTVAKLIDSGRWMRLQHHRDVIEQYEERLNERDQAINRQQRIIERSGGVADGALHVAERLSGNGAPDD